MDSQVLVCFERIPSIDALIVKSSLQAVSAAGSHLSVAFLSASLLLMVTANQREAANNNTSNQNLCQLVVVLWVDYNYEGWQNKQYHNYQKR